MENKDVFHTKKLAVSIGETRNRIKEAGRSQLSAKDIDFILALMMELTRSIIDTNLVESFLGLIRNHPEID
ncbi:MAG: hypothetical protein F6K24_58220 [Okeania sp. SIO2D1]|nr:hypothetical protein [Okeania sp. SIO2D1]